MSIVASAPPALEAPPLQASNLQRNANALVLGVALTTGLGYFYWVLAARLYDADDVGKVSALIGTMTFLSTVATLGLTNGLVRYLPATSAPGRLIRNAYVVSGCAGAVAAGVFLSGQPLWAQELDFVRANVAAALVFVAATSVWVLFALKDSVMTGLLQARLVPVQNGTYAAVKLLALVAFVPFAAWGVFVSWTLPALLVLLPVNWYVSRRVLPSWSQGRGVRQPLPLRAVVEFAALDYVASLLWMGTTQLMPLIVLTKLSAEASATYYISFSIAYALYLVTSSVGSAFLAEAATHPEQAAVLLRRAARQATTLVVPASIVGIVVAPVALRLYGADYVEQGAWLLRLLLASAIPQVAIGLVLADARHHGNTRFVVGVYSVLAVAVLGPALLTIGRFGLVAAGWTWLLAQVGVCAYLLWRRRTDVPRLALEFAADLRRTVRVALSGRRLRALMPDVERVLEQATGFTPDTRDAALLASDNSTLVVAIGDYVAKVAVGGAGVSGLAANVAALRDLREDRRLAELHPLLPRLVAVDDGEQPITVETRCDGIGVELLGPPSRQLLVGQFAAFLGHVNAATASSTTCNERRVRDLVTEPIARLRAQPWLEQVDTELEVIGRWLCNRLRGAELVFGRTHGDPWAANALARETATGINLSGVIDWEDSRPDGLLDVDLALLWISTSGRPLGNVVDDVFDDPHGTDEQLRAALGVARPNPVLDATTVIVLAWLHHVDGQLVRSRQAGYQRAWLDRNVARVATTIATAVDPGASGTTRLRRSAGRRRPPTAAPSRERLRRWLRTHRIPLAAQTAAVAIWTIACTRVDVAAMNDYGLASVLNVGHVVALGILAASFVWSLRVHRSETVLALHVIVLVGIWQITPAVLYDTLRLAWAWKHTGIVEYLLREGQLDTTVAVSPIYHSWPGFFAGAGMLTELLGARSAVTLAIWTPLVLGLLTVVALRALLRSFTDDVRVIWLATWFFVLANWVGQDYFSPQGISYVLYLMLLAVVLRSERAAPARRAPDGGAALALLPRGPARVVAAAILVTLASSHQITPLMAIIALAALCLARQIRPRFVLPFAVVATVGWALTIGRGVLSQMSSDVIDEFGDPLATAEVTLDRSAFLNEAQRLVSQAGRGLVVGMVALAVIGLVRQWQRGRLDRAVAALLLAPAVLVPVTPFGGEVLFRSYLFAVPFLAYAAATAIYPDKVPVDGRRPALATVLITAVMLPSFVLACFGKDRQYSFTDGEVAAATWLYEHAPSGSTIIEGSTNSPRQLLRYEQFTYVPIASEPAETRDAVVANPTFVLGQWLADEQAPATYLLLTESQAIGVDSVGPLPPGSIEAIETALLDSPRFEVVYANDDAMVIQLARRA